MGLFSFVGNLLGQKGSNASGVSTPEYYLSSDYTETQNALKGLGLGLLKGEVPDYYKAIGETGSTEFENMLGLTIRDIQNSAAEASAAGGRARGGSLPAMTAQSVADAATKLRYSDFERSLTGKQNLLNLGVNTTSSARTASQWESSAKNDFNWKDYAAELAQAKYEQEYEAAQDAQVGELIGTIASAGLGFATGGATGLLTSLAGVDMSNLFGGTTTQKTKKQNAGVASIGSIDPDEFTMKSGYNSLFGGK